MKLYFRIRKQGAFVYRMDVENRQRRLELIHVATVTPGGDIRPQKNQQLTPGETAEIEAWRDARDTELAAREAASAALLVEQINLVAGWVQSQCTDEQIAALSDPLLMAMHDLRQTIVRRLSKAGDGEDGA